MPMQTCHHMRTLVMHKLKMLPSLANGRSSKDATCKNASAASTMHACSYCRLPWAVTTWYWWQIQGTQTVPVNPILPHHPKLTCMTVVSLESETSIQSIFTLITNIWGIMLLKYDKISTSPFLRHALSRLKWVTSATRALQLPAVAL